MVSVNDVRIISYVRNVVNLIYGHHFRLCTKTVDCGYPSIIGLRLRAASAFWVPPLGNVKAVGFVLDRWGLKPPTTFKSSDSRTRMFAMPLESLNSLGCLALAQRFLDPWSGLRSLRNLTSGDSLSLPPFSSDVRRLSKELTCADGDVSEWHLRVTREVHLRGLGVTDPGHD